MSEDLRALAERLIRLRSYRERCAEREALRDLGLAWPCPKCVDSAGHRAKGVCDTCASTGLVLEKPASGNQWFSYGYTPAMFSGTLLADMRDEMSIAKSFKPVT